MGSLYHRSDCFKCVLHMSMLQGLVRDLGRIYTQTLEPPPFLDPLLSEMSPSLPGGSFLWLPQLNKLRVKLQKNWNSTSASCFLHIFTPHQSFPPFAHSPESSCILTEICGNLQEVRLGACFPHQKWKLLYWFYGTKHFTIICQNHIAIHLNLWNLWSKWLPWGLGSLQPSVCMQQPW